MSNALDDMGGCPSFKQNLEESLGTKLTAIRDKESGGLTVYALGVFATSKLAKADKYGLLYDTFQHVEGHGKNLCEALHDYAKELAQPGANKVVLQTIPVGEWDEKHVQITAVSASGNVAAKPVKIYDSSAITVKSGVGL